MNSSRRNRIISVRVSQQEYEQIEQITCERGAQSVSDLVRSLLKTWGASGPVSGPCTCGILPHVAALERQVDRLSDLITQSGLAFRIAPAEPVLANGETPLVNRGRAVQECL